MPLIHLRRRHHHRPYLLGIFGITSILMLGLLIYLTAPNTILLISLFYILLFLGLFGLCSFIFNNTRHGILIATATTLYFLLRFLHLRSPFYLILILLTFAVLELYLRKR